MILLHFKKNIIWFVFDLGDGSTCNQLTIYILNFKNILTLITKVVVAMTALKVKVNCIGSQENFQQLCYSYINWFQPILNNSLAIFYKTPFKFPWYKKIINIWLFILAHNIFKCGICDSSILLLFDVFELIIYYVLNFWERTWRELWKRT